VKCGCGTHANWRWASELCVGLTFIGLHKVSELVCDFFRVPGLSPQDPECWFGEFCRRHITPDSTERGHDRPNPLSVVHIVAEPLHLRIICFQLGSLTTMFSIMSTFVFTLEFGPCTQLYKSTIKSRYKMSLEVVDISC